MQITSALLITAASLLLIGGCAPSKVAIERSPELNNYTVKSIAIIPFDAIETPQMTEPRDAEFSVPAGAKRSDMSMGKPDVTSRLDYPTVGVPTYAAEKITRMIYGRLQNWQGIRVVPYEDVVQAMKGMEDAKAISLAKLAQQIAGKLGADALLFGKVFVYRERGGSKFGGDPATVGFEIKLVAADGRALWVGNYYEQQRPLTEDVVGFVQRGGVFVTAEQLAQFGAERLVREFPYGEPVSHP
jgi:hypothetical protein